MRQTHWLIGGWLTLGLLLGACGSPATPTATPPPTEAPTAVPTLPPTATPTVAPTTSPTPTMTPVPTTPPTPTPAPSPTAVPTRPPTVTAAPTTAAAGSTPDTLKPATTPRPAVAAPAGPPPAEITRALAAMNRLTSYRVKGTARQPSGAVELLIEYVAPDRHHIVFGGIEIISIGADSYMKFGSTWQKGEGTGMAPNTSQLMEDFTAQATFTREGAETVAGEPCVVFSYVTTEGNTGRVWVSSRDDLIRKIESKDGESEIILTLGDFNTPIEIKAPI